MAFSGVANIAQWYPWRFSFTASHFWMAWVTMGAIVAHVGAKWAISRRALARPSRRPRAGRRRPGAGHRRPSRGRRRAPACPAGACSPPWPPPPGLLTLTTIGQTVPAPAPARPARPPRPGHAGRRATRSTGGRRNAGVRRPGPLARLPARPSAAGWPRPLSLDHAQLLALPAHDAVLPIACVEGWSYSAAWSGVRVRDLLAMAGAEPDRTILVESLEPNGAYRTSTLNPGQAADRDTLLATHLDGEPLALDHGFPCRLIAPNRPGVLQTKWVTQGGGAVTGPADRREPAQRRATTGPGRCSGSRPPSGGWSSRWGLRGIFQHSLDTRPANLAQFVVGGALLHDLLVAPLVILAGVAPGPGRPGPGPGRSCRPPWSSPACVALFSYPLVRAYGLAANNPTSLPHNYAAEPPHRPRRGVGGRRRRRDPSAAASGSAAGADDSPAEG